MSMYRPKQIENKRQNNPLQLQSQQEQVGDKQLQQVKQQQNPFYYDTNHLHRNSRDAQKHKIMHSAQQLEINILIFKQKQVLQRVFAILQQKIYWSKFTSLKIINLQHLSTEKGTYKNHQLKTILNSSFLKENSPIWLKNSGLSRTKSNICAKSESNNKKTQFIIKYIISPQYRNLSLGFMSILKHSQNHSLFKPRKNQQNTVKVRKIRQMNEQKLIKFHKQSVRLKLKAVSAIIRNFVFKKIIKSSFNSIKTFQQYHSQSNDKKRLGMTFGGQNQSKDARFVKKKILPHKIIHQISSKKDNQADIQSLSSINICSYQIKTIKKKHFFILNSLERIVGEKKIVNYNYFLQKLLKRQPDLQQRDSYLQKQSSDLNKSSDFQNTGKQTAEQEPDLQIMRNVAKNMCYLSARLSKKHQKTQKSHFKKAFLTKLNLISVKKLTQLKLLAFYSLKMHIYRENARMIERINELDDIKSKYLDYFDHQLDQEPISCQNP